MICIECGKKFTAAGRLRVACLVCASKRQKVHRAILKKVNAAVRSGALVPQPCEMCQSPKAQAHHEDYSKPLDVRWLCSLHHRQRHAEMWKNGAHPRLLMGKKSYAPSNAVDLYIADRIRSLRREREMSQKKLGRALGVTYQMIQKYERGSDPVTIGRLVRIAETLDQPLGAFLPDGVAL